jgi:hypothetical protein
MSSSIRPSPRRKRRWLRSTVVLPLVLVFATGCGLTTQDEPHPVASTPLDPATVPAPPHVTSVVQIYFVRDERLVPVPRTGRSRADAVALLSAGPSPLDREADLESRLVARTVTLAVQPDPDIVVVDVSPDFTALSERDQLVAAAQLVWTATDVCCATRVRVRIGARPLLLPTDGGPTDRPVRREDYRSFVPD